MSRQDKTRVDPESRKNRNRQLLLFSTLVAAVLFALALWLSAGGGGAPPPPMSGVRAELAGAGSAEAVWVRRSESRIGQMEARLRDMETKNRRIDEENARLRERLVKDAADGRLVIDRQAAAIDQLRRKLEARPIAPLQAKRPARGAGMKRPAKRREKFPGEACSHDPRIRKTNATGERRPRRRRPAAFLVAAGGRLCRGGGARGGGQANRTAQRSKAS